MAKKHMKRLNAPKHWMLNKMGGIWAPKPSCGPHKQRESLPLSLILRNRLHYALTRKESMAIVMQKLVKVDGKIRTDLNFPAGFMGVYFRLMHSRAGAARLDARDSTMCGPDTLPLSYYHPLIPALALSPSRRRAN